MISPSIIPFSTPSTPQSPVPKLKIKRFNEALHLGDSMRIVAVHEKGYMAQLNGSGAEVLLVQGPDTPEPQLPSDTSPATSRSLPSYRRSSSLPSPSRSLSQSTSRSLDGLDLGDLRLSPRGSSSPSLPSLYPRSTTSSKRMTTRGADGPKSPRALSPRATSPRIGTQSTPTSPRAFSPLTLSHFSPLSHTLSPPIPPDSRTPPIQRRNGMKPLAVQRSPSYNFYPVQGWVLWRRTIGQWERVWMASKKSPTRVCFYTSENEDSEEREPIKVEELRSLWAPEEDSTKQKLSQSIHFRLFTERKTIYLIVQTAEKMRYWIAGLRKLNPDMEIDVRGTMDPTSPLSPRAISKIMDSTSSFAEDSYGTDDESDSWD